MLTHSLTHSRIAFTEEEVEGKKEGTNEQPSIAATGCDYLLAALAIAEDQMLVLVIIVAQFAMTCPFIASCTMMYMIACKIR